MSWVNFDPCIDSCHQLKQTSRKHLRSQNHLMFWLHKKFCLSLIKANIPENSSICAWPSNTTGEMESRRSLPMPAKPQSCLHVCLAEPSLCFSCQQLLSTECENQIRLKPRTWTYTSFPPDSLTKATDTQQLKAKLLWIFGNYLFKSSKFGHWLSEHVSDIDIWSRISYASTMNMTMTMTMLAMIMTMMTMMMRMMTRKI